MDSFISCVWGVSGSSSSTSLDKIFKVCYAELPRVGLVERRLDSKEKKNGISTEFISESGGQ